MSVIDALRYLRFLVSRAAYVFRRRERFAEIGEELEECPDCRADMDAPDICDLHREKYDWEFSMLGGSQR